MSHQASVCGCHQRANVSRVSTTAMMVDDLVRNLAPEDPLFILRPDVVFNNVEFFRNRLDAELLYAVKCNSSHAVLKAMHDCGVGRFDTASLSEIAAVSAVSEKLQCHFHHPVKSRSSIRESSAKYGVCHFTIDSDEELSKIGAEIEPEGNAIHVRLAVPSDAACCGPSDKFGATVDRALLLLKRAKSMGFELGLSFHVGTQCRDQARFLRGLDTVAAVLDKTDVDVGWINCGGGFPVETHNKTDLLQGILDLLSDRLQELRARTGARILVEPGRALVATAISLVVRVQHRTGQRLFLNDGIYGALSKGCCGCEPSFDVRALGGIQGDSKDFSIFGPTCDLTDRLHQDWHLPEHVAEGDWIEVAAMGAYSGVLATHFNGFHQHKLVDISELEELG